MIPRERVKRAVRRKTVDRLPLGEICVDEALAHAFAPSLTPGFERQHALLTHLGLDLVCLPPPEAPTNVGAVVARPEQLPWPDLARWVRETELFVFVTLDGPFGFGCRALGWMPFLMALERETEKVEEMFQNWLAQALAWIRHAADRGAHGLVVADDIAYGKGPFVSPARLQKTYFPWIARLVAAAKEVGLPVFFHSDGNLNPLLLPLADTGVHGLHCLDPRSGMDFAPVKKEYGDRLCLWGNLDPALLTGEACREKVERHVAALLESVSDRIGWIFGTTSGLFSGMNLEAVSWAYQAVRSIAR
ncbi:uroporphyrinogen decarboxylase [Desulfacinum hydrothermale DSM 13146]|uniref:Uroporphyrinogen decarboxylase n=1 Tax=Desulfacinum hydrothermale DSM 13146 TaxID=1121390 RepID=A0A1W1XD33_9BACT|nr:uroporphyrinogen decarboxylase family protein [Desulfacinum hydrothermale]SMC21945.1 uroporphyrinogen decarboxylase [Desulfacinum hydrothermale DSM 13146]